MMSFFFSPTGSGKSSSSLKFELVTLFVSSFWFKTWNKNCAVSLSKSKRNNKVISAHYLFEWIMVILCWCFKDNTFVVNFLSWQISDAYHWMEDPDSEETKAFVEAQNNISRPFLDSCPVRDKLNKRYINMQQLTTW